MLTKEIRSSFLNFFKNHGHEIVDSSPVVPYNDPTLLFTNAGMVQFKEIFTGLETRAYKRATTAQKCIRAGGKHNDLDQVGFTARHHTFFEMLGNFSFGDYFKEDAIYFAWTFLTKELGLDKKRLLATVYHTDDEALNLWKKIAGNIDVIKIHTNDNFWSMGDVGPCGPCTEIFFDHGDKVFGGKPGSENENGDRFMEIWNLVFMQYEQLSDGSCVNLKKQSIDTGMGLERISAVVQGAQDNYATDMFKPIIEAIKLESNTNFDNLYPSYKVIADHVRSVSFLIADGVLPSNEGRGYVLRRILRRSMRHGNMIGIKNPFLHKISANFIDIMKDAYPELENMKSTIESTIFSEEEKFLDTLDRGLKILQADLKNIKSGGELSGDKAFKLYDTYGFPLDLTQDILKNEKITVDTKGFEEALAEQKNRAKWAGSGDKLESAIWRTLKEKQHNVEFVGYEKDVEKSKIVAIIQNDAEISTFSSGTAFVITEKTPFYAECGGQCGDTGEIIAKSARLNVINTIKFCDTMVAHECKIINGSVKVSDIVDLAINKDNRKNIGANHTATHLLQSALRSVLGNHIVQRGSSLNEDRLRFDFSHNSALSEEEIQATENIINQYIMQNLSVDYATMSKFDAIEQGAMALFGEKYSDTVRTVKISDVSFELCGGTHAKSTSEIGCFKILSEVSIGSGVRRIEAITGYKVIESFALLEDQMYKIADMLKCSTQNLCAKIEDTLQELKHKNKEILVLKQKLAAQTATTTMVGNISVVTSVVSDYSMEDLRSLNDSFKKSQSIIIVVSDQSASDKLSIAIGVSQDLQKQYKASAILKTGLEIFDGKGGGSATFAQGGGSGKDKLQQAIRAMSESVVI